MWALELMTCFIQSDIIVISLATSALKKSSVKTPCRPAGHEDAFEQQSPHARLAPQLLQPAIFLSGVLEAERDVLHHG